MQASWKSNNLRCGWRKIFVWFCQSGIWFISFNVSTAGILCLHTFLTDLPPTLQIFWTETFFRQQCFCLPNGSQVKKCLVYPKCRCTRARIHFRSSRSLADKSFDLLRDFVSWLQEWLCASPLQSRVKTIGNDKNLFSLNKPCKCTVVCIKVYGMVTNRLIGIVPLVFPPIVKCTCDPEWPGHSPKVHQMVWSMIIGEQKKQASNS